MRSAGSAESVVVIDSDSILRSSRIDYDADYDVADVATGVLRRGYGDENHRASDSSAAPYELLLAISTLRRRHIIMRMSDDVPRNSNVSTMIHVVDGTAECDYRIDDGAPIIANRAGDITSIVRGEGSNGRTDDDDSHHAHHSTGGGIGKDLDARPRPGGHAIGRYEATVNAFEEERSSEHELLSDRQLIGMFHFLVNKDVSLSYEVLGHYAARREGGGRLVRLDMYQRIINRIRSIGCENAKYESNPRRMKPREWRDLVLDITRHIQENYADGTRRVYQYILLPELVMALMECNNRGVKFLATSIMNYILERKFPVLNPELYEHVLSRGRHGGINQDPFPYHKVLTELVLSGKFFLNDVGPPLVVFDCITKPSIFVS
jgi:hypothetical protein